MHANRLVALASNFYENYARDRYGSREYDTRHEIEMKLRSFEREVWNEAIEAAAREIEPADIAHGVRALLDAVLALRRGR